MPARMTRVARRYRIFGRTRERAAQNRRHRALLPEDRWFVVMRGCDGAAVCAKTRFAQPKTVASNNALLIMIRNSKEVFDSSELMMLMDKVSAGKMTIVT